MINHIMNIWTSLDIILYTYFKEKKLSSFLAENLAQRRNYIQDLN